DLLVDLQAHGRPLRNLRLDAQGEADVPALDRLEGIHRRRSCGGDRRGGREAAGDERNVLTDDDFRLIVVEGEDVGGRQNVAELVRGEGSREGAQAPDRGAVGQGDGL